MRTDMLHNLTVIVFYILCYHGILEAAILPIENDSLNASNSISNVKPQDPWITTTVNTPIDDDFTGRIVLTNVKSEDSATWGLSQDEAEKTCQKLPASQLETPSFFNPLRLLLQSLRGTILPYKPFKNFNIGHLLSISSQQQIATILKALDPAPEGTFWTGGRVIKYRVNNRKNNTYKIKLVLIWTDGRPSSANILALPQEAIDKLDEGKEYCLSIDFSSTTWQARGCEEKLAFACLLTQVGNLEATPITSTNPEEIIIRTTETTSLMQTNVTINSTESVSTFSVSNSTGSLPIMSIAAAVDNKESKDSEEEADWQDITREGIVSLDNMNLTLVEENSTEITTPFIPKTTPIQFTETSEPGFSSELTITQSSIDTENISPIIIPGKISMDTEITTPFIPKSTPIQFTETSEPEFSSELMITQSSIDTENISPIIIPGKVFMDERNKVDDQGFNEIQRPRMNVGQPRMGNFLDMEDFDFHPRYRFEEFFD